MVVNHSTTLLTLDKHQALQLTVKAASITMASSVHKAKPSDIYKAEHEVKQAIKTLPPEKLTSLDFTYFKACTRFLLKDINNLWEKFQDLIHYVLDNHLEGAVKTETTRLYVSLLKEVTDHNSE